MLGIDPKSLEQECSPKGGPAPEVVKQHAQEALSRIRNLVANSPKRDPKTGLVIRDHESAERSVVSEMIERNRSEIMDRFGAAAPASGVASDHGSIASRVGGQQQFSQDHSVPASASVAAEDATRAASEGQQHPGSGGTQQPQAALNNMFDALDRNHDGQISREEWQQGLGGGSISSETRHTAQLGGLQPPVPSGSRGGSAAFQPPEASAGSRGGSAAFQPAPEASAGSRGGSLAFQPPEVSAGSRGGSAAFQPPDRAGSAAFQPPVASAGSRGGSAAVQEYAMSASRLATDMGSGYLYSAARDRTAADAGSIYREVGSVGSQGQSRWASSAGSAGRFSNSGSQATGRADSLVGPCHSDSRTSAGLSGVLGQAEEDIVLSKLNGVGAYGFVVLPNEDKTMLIVMCVDEGGLLASWNRSHPANPLQEGDILASVNGISGDAQAMQTELANYEVRLKVAHVRGGGSAAKVAMA